LAGAKKAQFLKPLENVRVVLVETKFSGNLGLVARIMKNLGFEDLRLVRPRAELNKEAYQRAVIAGDVLDRAQIYDELFPAICDCGLVIGTSRRHGVKRKNIISAEKMAELVVPVLNVNKVAILFGSEDVGLTNEDIKYCQWVVGIHPGTEYESLSLSHAVAIVLWEINSALRLPKESERRLASAEELERMYNHLEEVLCEIKFIESGDPRRMLLSFRALFNRAMLSPREVKMIRGVLRQIRWRIEQEKKKNLKGGGK